MQNVANAILRNNPEVYLFILLIDERPEEVTDMERTCQQAEVISSTLMNLLSVTSRLRKWSLRKPNAWWSKKDVVILLDSITRLARAYNTVQPHSGKILSGGGMPMHCTNPNDFLGLRVILKKEAP